MLLGSTIVSLVVFLAHSITALEIVNVQAGDVFVPGNMYPIKLDDEFLEAGDNIRIELWGKNSEGEDAMVSTLDLNTMVDGEKISVMIPEDAQPSSDAFFRLFFEDQVVDSARIQIEEAEVVAVKAFVAEPLTIFPIPSQMIPSGEPLTIYPTTSVAILNTASTIYPTPTTKTACCKNGHHTCSKSSSTSTTSSSSSSATTSSSSSSATTSASSSSTAVPTTSSYKSSTTVKPSATTSTSSAATAKASISAVAVALLMAFTVLLF